MAYPILEARRRLIAGLRELADFLESRPEVPAPSYVDAMVFVPAGSDEDMRAEVDRITDLVGSQVDPRHAAYGLHRTVRSFGPVQYGAVAVLADARARHEALQSYSGAVVPDAPQEV